MNIELLKNNYLVVQNFISPEHAKNLEKEFHVEDSKFNFNGDPQAPNSASVYNYLPALELLANKTSHVSKIVGETVLPTYVYSRIYRDGSILTKHRDRPSCEISITLHLGGDKPWPIWIETPEKEERCVTLNPGDGMLYLGCIASHWRNKFEGTEYTQFFLHYVRSRGYCAPAYFDGERDVDEDFEFLLEEYEEMKERMERSEKSIILPKKYREREKNFSKQDSGFFNTINKQKRKILSEDSIEIHDQSDQEEFVDFDDVIVCNKKYKDFLIKKDSPELLNTVKQNKKPLDNAGSSKSLKDFIWYCEEAIDPEFCDNILDEYVDTDYWEPTLTGSGHDPEVRRCNCIAISDHTVINENKDVRKDIDDKLFEIVKDLVSKYQERNPQYELEIVEDSGYELLKYEEGDFYLQHSDSFKTQPRTLTIIMSMNDAYEGGEVALFDRELIYKLNAGDVLIFPSNFMYPHEILPVKSGTRFSIITWVV